MPDIKRSIRNPCAGANHKMVLSMISFMLLFMTIQIEIIGDNLRRNANDQIC